MTRVLTVMFGAWLLAVAGCAFVEGGCGCGADPSDPLSEHDLSFAGDHLIDNQCLCRCGDDDPEAFPKNRTCSDYEDACVDREGRERTSVCN